MRTRSRRWADAAIGQRLQFATGCIAPPSGHANLTQLVQAVDGAAQTRGRSWTPGATAWARPMADGRCCLPTIGDKPEAWDLGLSPDSNVD